MNLMRMRDILSLMGPTTSKGEFFRLLYPAALEGKLIGGNG